MEKTELRHHGIKGMKWGIRRYQNPDGSLTAKGKKRYSDDAAEAAKIKTKKVSQMSNAELKKINERQNLERNYRQSNKGAVAKGLAFVAGAAVATTSIITLYNNGNKLIKIGKSAVDAVGNMVMNDLTKGLARPLH